jgi:hypothetical protein
MKTSHKKQQEKKSWTSRESDINKEEMRVHISAGLTSSTSDFSFRHIRPEYKKKPLAQGFQKVEHIVGKRIVTPY